MSALFNTACSSSTPPPPTSATGPVRYIVTADTTAFYKYGPAQANGADMQLKKGSEVVMLERHYGYSRVQILDGDSGYIPTDDIAPSPHQPTLAAAPMKKSGGGSSGSHGGRKPDFDQPNDVPLPSTQPPSDEPVPSFRY
ncbi:MAG: hypothetical protein WCD79_14850 [Chthoniobacteraceae bacterium]